MMRRKCNRMKEKLRIMGGKQRSSLITKLEWNNNARTIKQVKLQNTNTTFRNSLLLTETQNPKQSESTQRRKSKMIKKRGL